MDNDKMVKRSKTRLHIKDIPREIGIPCFVCLAVMLLLQAKYVSGQPVSRPAAPLNAPSQLRVDLLRYPDQVYQQGRLTNYTLPVRRRAQPGLLQYNTVNSKFPGFSWVDPLPVQQQTAFQIRVSTGKTAIKKGAANVWNSGKISSRQNVNVVYSGPALKPATVYYWQVRVWDEDNKPTAYSAVQSFETGDSLSDYALPGFLLIKTMEQPVDKKRLSQHSILYDFGKDGFSQPVLAVDGRRTDDPGKQDTLVIRLGEMLTTNGHVNTMPPGTVRYRELLLPIKKGRHHYTLTIPSDKRNTGPNAIKMPAYIGEVLPLRFIEVSGDLKKNQIISVKRAMVHIPFNDQATEFTSSDKDLNRVWELCKYTIKATSFSGYYVDGDRERIPYEADALINQLSHYSSDPVFNMAKRTLDYLIYHPTWPTEWSLQNPLIAYYDLLYSGDSRNLAKIYSQLKPKLLMTLEGRNGLISTRTGKQLPEFLRSIHYKVFDGNQGLKDIVDWPHTEKETDGFVFTDYNSVVNAFYYRALLAMASLARDLQKSNEALLYQKKAREVKKAFITHFTDPETGLVRDGIGTSHSSLHANMFAMAFGLVPATRLDTVLSFIKSRGLSCSVYGAQFLLEALGAYDHSNYARQLISSKDERSWINMLREGATMTMEAWGQAFKPNQDWNHAWGTAPANYIVRYLMGIQPTAPGFSVIQIKPHPGDLPQASIKYSTVRGQISVRFQSTADLFKLQVTIPGNTTANIYLPLIKNTPVNLTMDGHPVKGNYEAGYWVIRGVPAGNHAFSIK